MRPKGISSASRTLAVALTVGLLGGAWADPHQPTRSRPLSDFLSTQGGCLDYGPYLHADGCHYWVFDVASSTPIKNFVGWSTGDDQQIWADHPRAASVDYLGVANQWLKERSQGRVDLGTTVEGTVTERELADGTALVSVNLHTKNALVWIVEPDWTNERMWVEQPLLFGHRPWDVLAGQQPALGDSFFQVDVIIEKPGAPIPDLVTWPPLRTLSFRATADGPLPDGRAAKAIIAQTTTYQAKGKSPKFDGYPAESIWIKPVGP